MSHRKLWRRATRAVVVAAAVAALVAAGTAQGRVTAGLTGAGSSLVAPLVSAWVAPFQDKSGIHVSYNSIGSGGGIDAITHRQVAFGASDAPLSNDQFAAANGVIQIPWALSAVAIAYNLPGVPDHLRLTGLIIAKIWLGQITKWNDPAIRALNPGVNLPNLKITVIYRSDSSGTTFAFTDYLQKVSPDWKHKVGRGTLVSFPTGVSGKGNSGCAGVLNSTQGGIAYLGVDYTLQNHLKKSAVRNNAGKFLLPGIAQMLAAASAVTSVPANNAISISNPSARIAGAYPISTFTWIIVPLQTSQANDLRAFINWAVTTGQQYARKLLFAPLPANIAAVAKRSVNKIHT